MVFPMVFLWFSYGFPSTPRGSHPLLRFFGTLQGTEKHLPREGVIDGLLSREHHQETHLDKDWWFQVSTPRKNMKVSWDDDIPNIWENKKKNPNHQPEEVQKASASTVLKGFDSLTSEKLGQKNVRLRLGDLKLKLGSNENWNSTRKNNGSEHNNMCVLPANFQTNFFFHVGLVTFGCLMKQEKGEMLRLVVHPS